ncbi:class I SAM-dependent methyltransferase [Aspergillus affinis]|uniref:class I SAM-dependent methyltransferase n=1 Tax=Aspergillus affinis TaxID=1070780 RepID=UPI0022FEF197|nr:uncharacterized protein KD926_008429 [Aspergillus affinis]KAI9040228.1 hypothetical protein KD926_008429 [Aspergillus affinis]
MSGDYVLERDSFETSRLNLQHYYVNEVFGYLLHPSIPTGNPNLRIADVASGSGIWLSSLSRRLPPNVTLDGLDISFDNAPPKEFLPKNMTLRYWDIFSEVPEELVGVYDIVHISLVGFVLRSNDIDHVMGNFMRLLKPGGYLQWSEHDLLSCRFKKSHPDNKTEALEELYRLSIIHPVDARFKPTWVSNLPEIFRQHGLAAVESDVKDTPPDLIMPLHMCGLLVQERVVLKLKGFEWIEKIRDLLPEVHRETKAGSAWDLPRICVVGKKPLE